MAHISSMAYKETRNRDGSMFSLQMEAIVTLQSNELEFDLKKGTAPSAAGEMLIKYVSGELDHMANSFQSADKMIDEKPKQDPPKPKSETPKPQDPPKTSAVEVVPMAPKKDPLRIDPKDPRPDGFPCKGCEKDKRCPEPCEAWNAYQKSLNVSTATTEAPKEPAKTSREIYESQPKGPAVPCAPKAVTPLVEPDKPVEPGESKLTIVKCTVCGTACERKPSVNFPGKFVKYCPKCKANRRKDGSPIPPKEVKA